MGCGQSLADVKPGTTQNIQINIVTLEKEKREKEFRRYLHEAAELKIHQQMTKKIASDGNKLNVTKKLLTIGEVPDKFEKSLSKQSGQSLIESFIRDIPPDLEEVSPNPWESSTRRSSHSSDNNSNEDP